MQTTDDTMASSEQKSTSTDGRAAPAVQLSPSEKFFRYFQLEVTGSHASAAGHIVIAQPD